MEKKKAGVCREFGLLNSMTQAIRKTEPKLLARLNRMDREQRNFESLNEVTMMRQCLSGFSNIEVTLYQWAVLFS